MRKSIAFFLTLILVAATSIVAPFPRGWHIHHTWTLVQNGQNTACAAATTCAITVSPTGTGHLLVFSAMSVGGSNFTITAAATGAGTMALCGSSACHLFNTNFNTDNGFILSSTSGATSLTVTVSGAPASGWLAFVKEYSYTSGPISKDTQGTLNNASCTTSCVGVALTLTGTNDLIAQSAFGSPNVTAINSPYSGDDNISSGAAFAASPNTLSGTAPTWTLSGTGHMIFGAVAFTETNTTPPTLVSPFVIGVN